MVQFEKPKGDPSAWPKPATTVLSPYLKFGCLSARLFWAKLHQVRPCLSWAGLPMPHNIMQSDAASCQGWPADLGCPQPLLSAKELTCSSQQGGLEEHPQASAIT